MVLSGDDWFRSYADVPSVLRLSTGALVANWLPATDPFVEAYDYIYLAYSTDDGQTWSEPFTPHHDGTTTQHGFASIFERPEGGIGLVWLDGRQQELDLESPDGGAMSLRFATFDDGWVQTADLLVDDRVCECCPTTVGLTDEGVITAFRGRTAAEIRDIHVSRLVDGAWTGPVPVHDDRWTILACPVNGPMLSARGTDVVVALVHGGRRHGCRLRGLLRRRRAHLRRADPARRGRHARPGGCGLAARRLRCRRVAGVHRRPYRAAHSPGGTIGRAIGRGDRGRSGRGPATGYPRLALSGSRLIFAWTETTPPGDSGSDEPRIQVRVAEALLP